ncbi:MAG: outer membrane beta-barrel protein [Bacteroidetes bacterium]|nr:outer membrane beta-barrel protein [Bacteroidota bacterium]
MKKLNLLLTAVVLSCATLALAQTEKGVVMIGGTAGFDVQFEDSDNIVGLDVSPGFGIFVIDNLAVGADLTLQVVKSGDVTSTSVGLSPLARYYFGTGNTRIFIHGQFGYLTSKVDFGGGNDFTSSGGMVQVGPGVAFFLNKNVAIEGILAFTRYGGDYDYSDLGLRIGVQAYLSGE